VCEGCGDCSVQSNCVSVEPLETEFGRKRQINQNSCNKDFSCVKGFCPSFVTIEGGALKKPKKGAGPSLGGLPALPEPALPACDSAWGIVVAGVGGTGVITIGQLLGMAAHIEGKGIVTQDAAGLAQKGGATWSHVQIAAIPEAIHTTKVDTAKADLVVGCDAIVAAAKTTLGVMHPERTFVALNNHATPTASFVTDTEWSFPAGQCEQAIAAAVGPDHFASFDAEEAAVKLLGDSIYTNPMMLGYAWQHGRIPLTRESLMRAMELNGVQIEKNKDAFEWGRRCAHDLAAVKALFKAADVIQFVKRPSLDETIAKRVEFLTGYQHAAYAAEYQAFVSKVRDAEAKLASGTRLTEAVARYLFKLMAYKDEYEVARLHTDPAFVAKLNAQFEGDFKVVHHLAPPMFAKTNDRGELVKKAYGPWMRTAFGLLAKMKGLRGTALDPFGRTAERRTERALIGEYRSAIEEVLAGLTADKLPLAVEIAKLPEDIRGYGHVKERHLAAARVKWAGLMARWRAPAVAKAA
jgi:indolepyruvate ferredoxin oxidoreductase